jgi:hypothetical protein
MGCRIVGICLLVVLPGTVVAQAQTKAKTVEQLAAEVESLRTALSSANENLTKLAATSRRQHPGRHQQLRGADAPGRTDEPGIE